MKSALRDVVLDHLAGLVYRSASVVVYAAFIAVVSGGVVDLALTRAAKLQAAFDRQVDAGRFVYVIAAGAGTLAASDCEHLTNFSFVIAAGSVQDNSRVWSTSDTSFSFDRTVVSTGWIGVMYPAQELSTQPGLLVGSTVARRLGRAAGDYLAIGFADGSDPDRVGGVLPPAKRLEKSDRSVVVVRPPLGEAHACYVEVLPGTDQRVLAAGFPPTDQVAITLLHPELSSDERPERELAELPRTEVWVGVTLLLGVGAVHRAFRRRDIALYRLLGAGAPALSGLAAADLVVVVLPAALSGMAFAMARCATMLQYGSVRTVLLQAAMALGGALLTEPLIGLAVGLRMSVPSALKR